MILRALFPVKLAHTKHMSEDKVPLCDRHHFRMWPEELSFLPTVIFKCKSPGCGRYYGKRYGYFDLLPTGSPSLEQIDQESRSMKLCSMKRHAQSYMAITRPKNSAHGTRNLWCWYCYQCNPANRLSTV
jgi:hypothetical protein